MNGICAPPIGRALPSATAAQDATLVAQLTALVQQVVRPHP
jgi:hypothetical protein